MALALKVLAVERLSRRGRKITYQPTFSDVYAAGGQAVNFLAADANGQPAAFPGEIPDEMYVENGPPGFQYEMIPGTVLTTDDAAVTKLKIRDLGTAAELAGGAYPAGITDEDDHMRIVVITRF